MSRATWIPLGGTGDEVDERRNAVVDLDGDVFCGRGGRGLGVEGHEGLGGGGALLGIAAGV